jgi:hypothetical protein
LQSIISRISDPRHLALLGKTSGWSVRRQLSVWGEEAIGIQEKRTIRQILPVPWPEETFWDQVIGLIVQAAMEERSRKFVLPDIARRSYRKLLNPCQPSQVFHL